MKTKLRYLFNQFVTIGIIPFQRQENKRLEESRSLLLRAPTGIRMEVCFLTVLKFRIKNVFSLYMFRTYILKIVKPLMKIFKLVTLYLLETESNKSPSQKCFQSFRMWSNYRAVDPTPKEDIHDQILHLLLYPAPQKAP